MIPILNLDLFNHLINDTRQKSVIQNIIKDLREYLQNTITNSLENTSLNEISMLNKITKENNVTAEYRDKMLISRSNILQNYANRTASNGTMYYIYDKKDDKYLVSVCEEKRSNKIIELTEKDLPQGAGVDSVLRLQKGTYALDKEATEYIKEEMQKSFNLLLKDQDRKLNKKRVEGHIYEFIESTGKSIWLIDNTINSHISFEDFEFQPKVFENAKAGDLFQYINGNYQKYS